MMEKDHPRLSIRSQARLLGVNRNRLESARRLTAQDLALMRELDELHLEEPTFGTRRLAAVLKRRGRKVGRERLRRLMRRKRLLAKTTRSARMGTVPMKSNVNRQSSHSMKPRKTITLRPS